MISSRKDKDSLTGFLRREKEKEKAEKERAATVAATERLKTVIRRLPPNLPEEVFWQSVRQWVTDETITWKAYQPGKFKKKINKENIPSRAYIAFKSEELLAQFSKEYDGHVFRDKQGNESQAVVEFAPYQKVPPEKKKVDARNGTIEKDEDFISFCASLNQSANPEPVSIEALIAANQPPPMPKTTPLLEALKAEKSANKDKEAILRNHAHYKDPSILASTSIPRNLPIVSSTKDEAPGRKKAPQSKDAAQAEPSKKSKKAQAAAAKQQAQQQQQQAATTSTTKKDPPTHKPSKAARQQVAAAKAAAAAQAQLQAQAPGQTKPIEPFPMSASSSGEANSPVSGSAGGVAAQVSAAAAASRKGRPIVGLASRQLQAALSQVGAAAMERKRREREAVQGTSPVGGGVDIGASATGPEGLSEKGKEPQKPSDVAPGAAAKERKEKTKPTPPPSPRRDRTRRREKVGHQSDAPVKIPSIMQRPDGVPPPASQRDAGPVLPSAAQAPSQAAVSSSNAADGPSGSGITGGPPSRGGYRRGRGRGRGGPPHRGG